MSDYKDYEIGVFNEDDDFEEDEGATTYCSSDDEDDDFEEDEGASTDNSNDDKYEQKNTPLACELVDKETLDSSKSLDYKKIQTVTEIKKGDEFHQIFSSSFTSGGISEFNEKYNLKINDAEIEKTISVKSKNVDKNNHGRFQEIFSDLSQEKQGKSLGKSQSTISRWENKNK